MNIPPQDRDERLGPADKVTFSEARPANIVGERVGTVDEYGTIWSGQPGASEIIGDMVLNQDEETFTLYLSR